ncbi:MAG TPA: redox-regulated ATPase YchF [Candidatus Paceibacterota bacterium]|jgi:GTP-binding protein YchF|nr:redox-regulated ATPase YchF [Candidatus Paceibacterota bacterium]
MGLSIGIVGLPNVGKSTLFNALTKKGVPAENYPFCTIDPSVGIVAVPDERLGKLSAFSQSAKTIPGAIEFVDIAGLVEGASKGEGLGNKFLANIRETDAILEMVRLFPIVGGGTEIAHVYGTVDPLRDISVINLELILADFETVTKRRSNLARDVKRGDKLAVAEDAALGRLEAALEAGKLANTVDDLTEEESKMVKQLNLLTTKKFLYGLNKRSGTANLDETDAEKFKELTDTIIASGAQYVVLDAKIEDDLKDFEGEEKEMMRSELAGDDDGITNLITKAYELLGLETFFTTGADETRAWTIKKGSTAPIAGTAIHTDFKDKFIRAEVVFWKDLLDAGSYGEARAKGQVRTEGKEYIVKDGDVIEFKI